MSSLTLLGAGPAGQIGNPASISGLMSRVFDAGNNSFTDLAETTNPNNTDLFRSWSDVDTAGGVVLQ